MDREKLLREVRKLEERNETLLKGIRTHQGWINEEIKHIEWKEKVVKSYDFCVSYMQEDLKKLEDNTKLLCEKIAKLEAEGIDIEGNQEEMEEDVCAKEVEVCEIEKELNGVRSGAQKKKRRVVVLKRSLQVKKRVEAKKSKRVKILRKELKGIEAMNVEENSGESGTEDLSAIKLDLDELKVESEELSAIKLDLDQLKVEQEESTDSMGSSEVDIEIVASDEGRNEEGTGNDANHNDGMETMSVDTPDPSPAFGSRLGGGYKRTWAQVVAGGQQRTT